MRTLLKMNLTNISSKVENPKSKSAQIRSSIIQLGEGGRGGGEERLFSVMPEIFYQLLWRQGGQVVWIPHLKSGGPGNKPSLAVSQLRPASGQLGFYTP